MVDNDGGRTPPPILSHPECAHHGLVGCPDCSTDEGGLRSPQGIAGIEHTARSVADAIECEFSPASTGDQAAEGDRST